MAQSGHISTEKSRWLKAVLGLGYTKEGLAPFCHDIAKKHHKDILDNIKQKTGILNKRCPRNHDNCCYLSSVSSVSVESCSIYDIMKGYYTSSNKPNLKNTEPEDWMKDPWSIAKCFIYTSEYKDKKSAADTDITGLLHVIINNTFFHNHVSCTVDTSDVFSKVRDYRNQIFHSSNQELEEQETNKYIDGMIAVLQDGKELNNRPDAQEAVKKLQDLKREDFVITTENYETVLGEMREDLQKITGLAEDNQDLKRIVDSHESTIAELKQLIKDLHDDSSKIKLNLVTKADLQKKLLKVNRDLLHMPAMPCQPDHVCNFEDVYVTPRITLKSKEKVRKEIEPKVKTMSEVFFKDGKPLESIYVVGEAGSGKSSFCKSLVYCWCMAQSDTQDLDGHQAKYYTEYHVDLIKVMKKFNFLFFLRLRDFTHKVSINDMLEEDYGKLPVLKELLENEFETCLIVLDGLDEWTTTTNCPPKRAKLSYYTVLTTSRPWKIASLGISDDEMRQRIFIRGFDDASRMEMITKTLKILQKEFPDNKKGTDECEKELSKNPLYHTTDTAMMLQQLICLCFDGKLHKTSRCNLHKSRLDLFFVWYKKKAPHAPLFNELLNKSYGLELPELFNDTEECKLHSYIVEGVSRLAYETLIKNEKETSLTFDSSMFQKLEIFQDIKDCCLELGILSEEKGPSLSASSSRKSYISFIHKSVQEYLAAVHIVWKIQKEEKKKEETTKPETRPSSTDKENDDVSENLSQMLNVKTLNELLEQENVLIMLCGMDTMVAKSVSKLIYNIVAKDDRVVRYRKLIHYDFRNVQFIQHIQKFILDCAEETKASFDLGDLVLKWDSYDPIVGKIEQNITLDNVMSFNIDTTGIMNHVVSFFDCMTKFKNLKTIQIRCDSTQVGLHGEHTLLFLHIANITHLVALRVEAISMTHEDITSLCTFLSGTCNLEQISLDIKCECKGQHEVDLSKHKQLQYLKYSDHVVVTNAVSTNLEFFHSPDLNKINCIKVLDFLSNSLKMKDLFLQSDFPSNESRTDSMGQYDHETILTRKLTQVISSTQQLRVLNLRGFTFTDNIITCPSEMKSLESIDISAGLMSLTTWKKFVDRVAELPQRVNVTAYNMCITRDGEECNPGEYRWRGGEKAADAFRYVQEREKFFHTLLQLESSIQFSTKK